MSMTEEETKREDTQQEEKKPDEPGRLLAITSKGETFYLPKTKNPLTLHLPKYWDFFEWFKNSSALVVLLVPFLPSWVFILLFIFWRLAYNLGLGILLYRQSNEKYITKLFERYGSKEHPLYPLLRFLCSTGLGSDYKFEDFPSSFNAWLAFRHLVDVILANDLMSYAAFCLAYWEVPGLSFSSIMCYIVGFFLCIFTLWAKTDAYRVVGSFAWYWGDFFFLVNQKLTFDRVFSISPHPMYIIGYSFFYGCSLITQSYTVLYVSLFGHFCQLAFLTLVENPRMVEDKDPETRKILYDMKTGYFRKDFIVFKNWDGFRSSDLFIAVVILYTLFLNLLNLHWSFYLGQALVWRLFHTVGLGYVLHLQSKENWFTNHFISNGYTKQYAFENWKGIYNLSLMMTHVAFLSAAVKYSELTFSFSGSELLKITFGLILLAVNMWSSVSTFEVLGEFGWFYGDFFIDEVPSTLYYSGIYRFVNNPDTTTGFAGYYGLALLSDSWVIFMLALFSQIASSLFVHYVEQPHMRKLYGNNVRPKSGIEQAISEIVSEAVEQNPQLKKIKTKADDLKVKATELNEKAKSEAKKLTETVVQKAHTITEKAKKEISSLNFSSDRNDSK